MPTRSPRRALALIAWLSLLLAGAATAAGQGFVGETTCGNNDKCHGGGTPNSAWTEKQRGDWHPWMAARTLWKQSSDHHSRAYATLKGAESAKIAGYMGIQATASEKCLVCHAPAATRAAKSGYRREEGVSCEHCHGPAEGWVDVHQQKDVWPNERAAWIKRGLFYDNNDPRLRAEKCASCHVEIDHEIIAGGHPPLQFEMVAHAQVMQHWDDRDERPAGAFSIDPTLWAIGQLVGLREAVDMTGRRAGNADYQSLGKFPHFADGNCYQCHHKLVDDALRQAQGHYLMSEILLDSALPAKKAEIAGLWAELGAASGSDARKTQQTATRLQAALDPAIAALQQKPLDQAQSRALLRRITASGDRLKNIRRFGHSQPDSNVTRIDHIGLPWWYTTGAPEQTILAILALCPAAYDAKICGKDGIQPSLKNLLAATDRFAYDPAKFAAALAGVNAKLPQ